MTARLLILASWLLCRLPEGPLTRLAELAGDLWYRLAPARAAQARRNLRRVAGSLAGTDRGTALARQAATDPRALEQLVRRAFRHSARYYLEVARTPALRLRDLDERLAVETPEALADAFRPGRSVIFVGLHFGAIELPTFLLSQRPGGVVAPMETLADPALQAWFVRSRNAVGVRIVGLREARRELLTSLRAGENVGIIGDRDVSGGGALTTLFGAPARVPLGPAMLSLEADAPAFVVAARRFGRGRYIGRVERIEMPGEGTRRERVTALTASIAAAFERVIELAPEQWWAVFFPIWPDLEAEAAEEVAS